MIGAGTWKDPAVLDGKFTAHTFQSPVHLSKDVDFVVVP